MTTLTIFTLFFLSLTVFAIVNLFLWLLEFIAATIQYMVDYFLSKPRDWKKSYLDIRTVFTRLLLMFSFAMLSPRAMVKHKSIIKAQARAHYKRKANLKSKFNRKE